MIYLKSKCGLCNRLRAIASGIRLAQEKGDRLCVVWDRDPGMNSSYGSLFERGTDFDMVDIETVASSGLRERFRRGNETYFDRGRCRNELSESNLHDLFARIGDRDIFLETCDALYADLDFSWLRPNKEVVRRMSDFKARMAQNCIGLHIRRTDHRLARIYSPLYLFNAAIERELDADGETHFFLATDDEEVKHCLCARYGSRIVTRTHVSERSDADGVLDGLVDLLLLADTKRIYGSHWSSFSAVAAQIGKIPSTRLKEQNLETAVLYHEQEIRNLNLRLRMAKAGRDGFYVVRYHKQDGSFVTVDQLWVAGESQHVLGNEADLGWTNAGMSLKGWSETAESKVVVHRNGAMGVDLAVPGATRHLYAVWG